MASRQLKIRTYYEGIRPQLKRLQSNLRISESQSLYFGGVKLKRRYILEPPGKEFLPTGEYDIQITRHTPEVVNNEQISSHDIQYVPGEDHGYEFLVSLTTTAMPNLTLKTKNLLRDMGLIQPPNGVRGYLNAEITGWFSGWIDEPATNSMGWHEVTFDTSIKDYQLLGDYSHLIGDLKQGRFGCVQDSTMADWEKCYFIWRGSELYVRYTDSKMPAINHLLPANNAVIFEDFQPLIAANFDDFGGSGIDPTTFIMTIDRQSVSDQINVAADTQGMDLTAAGFRYRPSVDLSVGLHQVEAEINDFQGNRAAVDWHFFLRYDTPRLLNCRPASGETIETPRPLFAADFSDLGARGLNLDAFELCIDDRPPIKFGARGLALNTNGFSYRPPINLTPGGHKYILRISDKAGKMTSFSAVFAVEVLPITQVLGDLPLHDLEGVGSTLESQYASNSGGLITTIKDLVNQNPQTLSGEIGIPLPKILDHVTRANLLCSQVSFNRMNFSELWNKSVWEIAHMSDDQILGQDQPLDEEGNIIVESRGDVEELRENIALLFICLDNAVLKSLTFGDIVLNQVEGTYYS
jgi:hypothetical protein